MDYSRPALADRLAAEYVLGTLRGRARARLEALLPAHPALRRAIDGWQQRLLPLVGTVRPVEPSATVWRRIEQRLFATRSDVPLPWWRRLLLWQGAAAVATVAALGLGALLAQTPPPTPQAPPIVLVIAPNPQAAGVLRAGFAAGVTRDGSALVLRPLEPVAPKGGQSLELWAVPPEGAPRSLGLVSGADATTVQRAALLQNTAAFAVSLEPAGGSPTGAPTGPVVAVGKL